MNPRDVMLQNKAIELAVCGKSTDEIAASLDVSKEAAAKMLSQGLRKARKEFRLAAINMMELELMRLDEISKVHFQAAKAGDIESTAILLKIMDKRAKYLGLDAPKDAPTDDDANEIDFTKLSSDELEVFHTLLTKLESK